jgi:glycosyltransferase involved in cell wall biosynthesis
MRLAVDVRSLLDTEPGGVGAYTRALLDGLQRIPEMTAIPVVTGRNISALPDHIRHQSVRCALPNRLVNLGIATLRKPLLDRLVGTERYLLPGWNFLALEEKTHLTLVVHDLSFERNPYWYPRKQRIWHRAVEPRTLVARADQIIAVSRWTKQDVCSLYGTPEKKIVVIPPVVDWEMGEKSGPERIQTVLFFGTVEERKNPLSLLRAFELIADKYPETQLVFAGRLGFGASRLVRAAQKSPCRSRIQILGYVSPEKRQQLFCEATVFAYPSFYEGFGIPLLDAMRHGLPIVTSNRSAVPEVVGDTGILVDPYDVRQIADGLDAVLENERFAHALGERAGARAATFATSMVPALGKLFTFVRDY